MELIGARAHPVFQGDRGLEEREGIALVIHRPLDAADQGGVDLLQPVDVRYVL
jgi:hypothetical protein